MMAIYAFGVGIGYGLSFVASTMLLLTYFGRQRLPRTLFDHVPDQHRRGARSGGRWLGARHLGSFSGVFFLCALAAFVMLIATALDGAAGRRRPCAAPAPGRRSRPPRVNRPSTRRHETLVHHGRRRGSGRRVGQGRPQHVATSSPGSARRSAARSRPSRRLLPAAPSVSVSIFATRRPSATASPGRAETAVGGIDVLVNNAGYGLVGAGGRDEHGGDPRLQFEVNVFGQSP